MSKKGGKDAKKKGADTGPSVNEIILRKLFKFYDNYCTEFSVKPCPDVINYIKASLEEDKPLTKILFRPIDIDFKAEERFKKALAKAQEENDLRAIKEIKANYSNIPPPVLVEPLMKALKDVQFSTCKDLFIIDVPLYYSDVVELTEFVKIPSNLIRKIEISDCFLQIDSIKRFSTCFNIRKTLSILCLDYNEFGDKGCYELCRGLNKNTSLISLSLNYCNLGPASGGYLGEILSTTALRELYLDGNDLRCHGAIDLIRVVVDEAESAFIKKEIEQKQKAEEEARRKAEGLENLPVEENEEKEKKKKKKKKKSKKSNEPPPIGPFVQKLHLADNAIDFYEEGNRFNSINMVHHAISMFVKLIQFSPELEELDLHNNTIGNMSAKMILNGLEYRKFKKVGTVAVRVSEKIEKELFDAILKASKKVKKKKGKKKKKS